jgi:hypothetical protein
MIPQEYPFSAWRFQATPLKNDGVKVSWDDDIPKTNGKIN